LEKLAGCVFKVENGEDRFLTNLVNINRTTVQKVPENNNIYLQSFWNSTSKSVMKVPEIHLTKI